MGYKYITLTSAEKLTLEEGSRNHPKPHFRKRCACLLLSDRGFEIKSLATIYDTRINTIGTWFNNWEEKGLVGLQVVKGQGRKAILSTVAAEVVQQIADSVRANPQDLCGVCQQLNQKFNLDLSKNQLKQFLKKG